MKRLLIYTPIIGLAVTLPAVAQQFKPGGDGIPIVCAFNTSPPAVSSGQFVYAQCSNNGTLLGSGGGGGGGTSSNFGSAFPSAGTAAGFKDSTGTNMVPGNLDASGNLDVNVAAGSFSFTWPGTAGNATGGTTTGGTMPYVNAYIRATSGSIPSGAFASGSIASGAIASGAVSSGAYVSGALADGAITTLGTEADAAWTSGSGTEISILKKIAGNTTPFSGAVTLGSGAVAAGAYAAGSFVSGALLSGALADGAITTMGTEADAAWVSGNGTEIAILKKIAGNTGGGGAVTINSGGVASGAYSSGSYASGALSDGAITTMGTEADAAWSSGSGTEISILKKIANNTVSNAITIGSGGVASGAYASGSIASGAYASGALADGAITTLGTEADAAWTSGSGTGIAILKKIANSTTTTSTQGTPGWTLDAIDTPITVTTTTASTTINSAAAEVLAENVGAASTAAVAYCGIGGTALTTWKSLQPGGGWFVWQVGGATTLSCISSSGGTTVNVQTGSGNTSGTGGGGAGGGALSWPGTAGTTSYGGSPSGTVPAVNAYITNAQALVTSNATLASPGASPNVPILQRAGGITPKILNALTNSGVAVDANPGQLFMIDCYNPNATVGYIQVYDATSITGTPKISIGVPATSHGGFTLSMVGVQFSTGIEVQAATTATGSSALSTAMDCNAAYN